MDVNLSPPTRRERYEITPVQYGELLRLAFVLCGSRDVAQDLVQDTYARCAPKLTAVTDPGSYLRTALVNRWRSQQRRRQVARAWLVRQQPPSPVAPVQLAEWHDQLLALPPRQRAAIALRYLSGLDDVSIAAAIGVKIPTVRSLIHRGLITLRKAADERP